MDKTNLIASGIDPDGRIGNSVFKGTILENFSMVPDSAEFFTVFIPKMVGVVLMIGVLAFFFMFLTGAIQWIVSGGDKNALEGAKGKITNALVGVVLLFVSFAIIQLLETFFDINILTLDIGALKIE